MKQSTHPRKFGNLVTVHRPRDRPSARRGYQYKITQSTSIATRMQLEVILVGKSHSHRRLVKQRQPKSQYRRKKKAEIVSVSLLSQLLSLDKLSFGI